MTNTKQATNDYGEPWKKSQYYDREITTRNGDHIVSSCEDDHQDRIISCVNACAGIPSETLTKEYIQEAIATLKTIKKINSINCFQCGAKHPFKLQCECCGQALGAELILILQERQND